MQSLSNMLASMSIRLKLDHPLPKTAYFLHEVYKMAPCQLSFHTNVPQFCCHVTTLTTVLSDRHAHNSAVMSSRLQLCCQIITLTVLLSCHHAYNSAVRSSRSQHCCHVNTLTNLLSCHLAYNSAVMSSRLQLCSHVITLTDLLSSHHGLQGET